jgi:hypothetical protein
MKMESRASSRKRTHLELKANNEIFNNESIVCSNPSKVRSASQISSKQYAHKASSWVTPLCDVCEAIFENWASFLQHRDFQLLYYGSHVQINVSAENGCTLCTQVIFTRESRLIEMADSCRMNGTLPTPPAMSADHKRAGGMRNERNLESASEDTLPEKISQGYVKLHLPGKGRGWGD